MAKIKDKKFCYFKINLEKKLKHIPIYLENRVGINQYCDGTSGTFRCAIGLVCQLDPNGGSLTYTAYSVCQ